jgi:signal transduction histidine kinase
VQAAGARAQGHPDDATLAKIESSGRESLVEMRRLLGVLRSQGGDVMAAPQPRLDDVAALADKARDAGVIVEIDRHGAATGLPPAVELTAYRIVQEALANVVRHAGPGARARVTLEVGRELVVVRVTDDGDGAAQDATATAAEDTGGHGLLGMRERVTLMGGQLRTGPLADGGFEVCAELPTGVAP